ncbi:MAG: YheT family hydrolase [Clostridiaceae bacterium]
MSIKDPIEYKASIIFRNKHLNTIYPTFFRKIDNLEYKRQRIKTLDNDFIDIDWSKVNSKKLLILLHGLEGSSNGQYIKGMGRIFNENKWDICAMNYRGCSGEINKTARFYHGGATEDIDYLINLVEKDYEEIVLVGFSLGGNILLKYLGDGVYKLNDKIKAGAAVSVPCDLKGSMERLSKKRNFIYSKRFLKALKNKVVLKKNLFPDEISDEYLDSIVSLKDFDDEYTAPIHGFKDGNDYYNKCSCKQFLKNIKIPTLIINALDDPFLSRECFPIEEAEINENLTLITPKHGGHVGFSSFGDDYWTEKKVMEFIILH